MSCFVCLSKSLQTGLATPFFPWFSEPDMRTLKCDRKKKKKLETGLLSADPSQDRLGHSFLPGYLRTNLNQQRPEVNHCCSVLEKETVLSLLLMATRELSDGQVHLGYRLQQYVNQ